MELFEAVPDWVPDDGGRGSEGFELEGTQLDDQASSAGMVQGHSLGPGDDTTASVGEDGVSVKAGELGDMADAGALGAKASGLFEEGWVGEVGHLGVPLGTPGKEEYHRGVLAV